MAATIEAGDVISVIGPSGTGKSTLLRCLNRLEEPTSGHIVVDGEDVCDPACDITRVRRKMGMVFQSFNLFQNLDILGNVCAAPIKLLKMPKDEAQAFGLELLERVGLKDKAESFPGELSGGQQHRAAIARALASSCLCCSRLPGVRRKLFAFAIMPILGTGASGRHVRHGLGLVKE